MDFYNQLLAQKLSGGGGGGDKYAAFKALVDRSITEVTADMLQGATSIGNYAFYYCSSLTSIEIPNGVTSIGNGAFRGCNNLINVKIPSSFTTFTGQFHFVECNKLVNCTIEAITPPIMDHGYSFNNLKNIVIYVPAESVDAYKSASGWSEYASKIQAIPSD